MENGGGGGGGRARAQDSKFWRDPVSMGNYRSAFDSKLTESGARTASTLD